MLATIGERLKCCRAAVGLKTADLVDEINRRGGIITANSYTRWERNAAAPSKRVDELVIIVDILKEKGLITDVGWILRNEGYPPQFMQNLSVPDDELFYNAAASLNQQYNWELIQLSGSYGEPFVNIGGMIIVSEPQPIHSLHNELARVETSSGNKIGIVNVIDKDNIAITAKETVHFTSNDIKEAKVIKWIRRV
jgi:hypothetical protein